MSICAVKVKLNIRLLCVCKFGTVMCQGFVFINDLEHCNVLILCHMNGYSG